MNSNRLSCENFHQSLKLRIPPLPFSVSCVCHIADTQPNGIGAEVGAIQLDDAEGMEGSEKRGWAWVPQECYLSDNPSFTPLPCTPSSLQSPPLPPRPGTCTWVALVALALGLGWSWGAWVREGVEDAWKWVRAWQKKPRKRIRRRKAE